MTELRPTFQASLIACGTALASVLVMAAQGNGLQPNVPARPLAEFLLPLQTQPEAMLRFFAGDSSLVLSYAVIFVGLSLIAARQSPWLARFGLGFGLAGAVLDAVENAHFITYASLASAGEIVAEPALVLIAVIGNLKWMGAFAALLAFGLVWPRTSKLDWVLKLLMLAFPLIGVIGVAVPELVPVRGLFFLFGFPLFAWRFWRELGRKNTDKH